MQKVEGSSPFIRSSQSPRKLGAFLVSEGADIEPHLVFVPHPSDSRIAG
jgi:hypothetical protein